MSENIKVAARCRPMTEEETEQAVHDACVTFPDDKTVAVIDHNGEEYQFPVDFLFPPDTTNDDLFVACINPLINRVMAGNNAAVFMYGASLCGKTHTILGDDEHFGAVARSAEQIFSAVQTDSSSKYLVTLSMMQIRDEVITDLLNPVLDSSLEVVEDRSQGAVVKDLAQVVVHDTEEVIELVKQGQHVMNLLVQRSAFQGKPHFLVDINVRSQLNGNLVAPTKFGYLRFISTMGTGGMATEADPSLRNLDVCVEGLSAGKNAWGTPYNQASLTNVMQQALGGNCVTLYVGAFDPMAVSVEDTLRTLTFGDHIKAVVNQPVQNMSTVAQTIQDLRNEIREARERLQLHRPGQYLHDLDPKLLDHLKQLVSELERAKGDTWEAKIKASDKVLEERKKNLHNGGLFIVLEEDVEIDNELMRKVDKERRNLVLQTYVVNQKEVELASARDAYNGALLSGDDEVKDEDVDALKATMDEATKAFEHQAKKLKKMKNNFSKYINQLVEHEEKQRKTFLMADESEKLHALREHEDWREMESLKNGDPKLRHKLKDIQGEAKARLDALQAKYENGIPPEMANAEALKSNEESTINSNRKMRIKLEEMKWERDQLLGRLIERDFRHEAQMSRLQKQMFMVFREYRRHFEEQKTDLEQRYRKLIEDSVHDTLSIHRKNILLEAQVGSRK